MKYTKGLRALAWWVATRLAGRKYAMDAGTKTIYETHKGGKAK